MDSHSDAPPPYDAIAHQQKAYEKMSNYMPTGLVAGDPRTSSQDSLLPDHGEHDPRRKLLLVYIHGFMGNETSFRSFPAHVHNLLVVLLSASHAVHTKIYPRYRSRGKITIARDDFSKWISAHEGDSVDVVLMGHSMGGLLSAEVALMPASSPAGRPLQHRIIGTINFDVPFLGMHPGVVKSGLSSIFKPSEEIRDHKWDDVDSLNSEDVSLPARSPSPARMDTLWAPGKADPNYNPSFANDVVLPVRKGWRSAWHFINKHSDDLTKATKKLVSSHLEFGGAMANYSELKTRYARIRALEEIDDSVRKSASQGGVPPRVRFINYYTVSTGRPKKPRSPHQTLSPSPHRSRLSSRGSSCRIFLAPEALNSKESLASRKSSKEDWEQAMETFTIGDKAKDDPGQSHYQPGPTNSQSLPTKPPPLSDLSYIQTPETRELVEQEHARAVAAYEKAVRGQENSDSQSQTTKAEGKLPVRQDAEPTRGRQQKKPESEMTHSEREALRLEKEKQRMEREGRRMRGEPEPESEPISEPVPPKPTIVTPPRGQSPPASIAPSTTETASTYDRSTLAPVNSRDDAPQKPKKNRTFCNLPPKDSNGERDPCWERVFMENVDEVGAHCGLFFVDERYERLVGDVASRIEGWVHDEEGSRISQGWKS